MLMSPYAANTNVAVGRAPAAKARPFGDTVTPNLPGSGSSVTRAESLGPSGLPFRVANDPIGNRTSRYNELNASACSRRRVMTPSL